MIRFWIGSVEEYEQGVIDDVKLDVTVNTHAPIYSPDRTEVLVKGIGDLTLKQVKEYQYINWVQEGEEDL